MMILQPLFTAFLSLLVLSLSSAVYAEAYSGVMTREKQQTMTPADVFSRLKEGNQRFVKGNMKNRNLLAQAKSSSTGQYPVAVLLSCMDSRTPPELIFDQGVGDVFVTRVAGNVDSTDILGSMEFGTKVAGAKLIAVIGHTGCGAMVGACQQVKLGNLTDLLDKIQPAVNTANKNGANDCKNPAHINQIAKDNVIQVIKDIKARSTILNQLVKEGKLGIVGGVHDVATGKVEFINEVTILPKKAG